MKKILVLTAVLLALALPLSALADTAPKLDNSVSFSGGRTTISWTSGDVPAGGYYVIVEALNPDGSDPLFQLAGNTSGSSVVTGLLAPEKLYRVYLVDSNFSILDQHDYAMPSVPVFEDGLLKDTSVKVSITLRRTDANGNYRSVGSFKSSEMNALAEEGSFFSCLKYQMQMPQLAYERTFYVQLVFEAPNGYTFTDKADDITFDRVNDGYQTIWWDYAGWDFFDQLHRQTGSIPSGEYKIHLYWDGCWVKTSSIRVD